MENDIKKENVLSIWRVGPFLALMSIALSSFLPLAIIAPAPLSLAFILYGRAKGVMLSAISLLFIVIVSSVFGLSAFALMPFVLVILSAALIAEIINKQYAPLKGIIFAGTTFVMILSAVLFFHLEVNNLTLKGEIQKAVEQSVLSFKEHNKEIFNSKNSELREVIELFNSPEKLADEFLARGTGIIIASVFFVFWMNFMMVLRNNRLWQKHASYRFTARDLFLIRMPDTMIYPVIITLAFVVFGKYFSNPLLANIGMNFIWIFGVFFFFHGLGVYSDFLNFLRIFRIMRAILMFSIIFLAWRVLVILGIFDMWFDFRKYFRRKREGDTI